MRKSSLDILLLTEIQINTSSVETHGDLSYFFSSDIQPGKSHKEHAGVGIVAHKRLKRFLYAVQQTSGRMMAIRLRSHGVNLAFICCYAPHSGHSTDMKEASTITCSICWMSSKITFIGGDFSARIQHRYSHEAAIKGSHIFGRGRSYLEGVASATRESRDLFVDFCAANDLRVLNTYCEEPMSKQVTFREHTTQIGDPLSPEKFAQLDFWLTKCKHRNHCVGVQSRTDIYLDNDHYTLELRTRTKLAASGPAQGKKTPKYAKPSHSQWQTYNQSVSRIYQTLLQEQDGKPWRVFNSALEKAAARCLSRDTPPPPPKISFQKYLEPHEIS